MIGSLRGVVLDRTTTGQLLVEVGGVGYRVTVSPSTSASSELGAPVFLHVHTHVREDALVLFGFATRDERVCFESLISAHGVGPALALSILSALSPSALHRALMTDDVDALTAVSGVGKKTAARLLIELKSRLDLPDVDLAVPGGGPSPARAEVRAALVSLGYGPEEVREALRDLPEDGQPDVLLRQALQSLAAAR